MAAHGPRVRQARIPLAQGHVCSLLPSSKGEHRIDGPVPAPTSACPSKRQKLASETEKAFRAFSKQVFADGALNGKTKQIIAVAVAHVTQCPYCVRNHTKAALRAGALPEELMEAHAEEPEAEHDDQYG